MDYKDVTRIIEEGEGFEVEFKRKVTTPEKIARALIAFANTKGGHILFGVDDDGSIVGVESEKSEVDLIHQAADAACHQPGGHQHGDLHDRHRERRNGNHAEEDVRPAVHVGSCVSRARAC